MFVCVYSVCVAVAHMIAMAQVASIEPMHSLHTCNYEHWQPNWCGGWGSRGSCAAVAFRTQLAVLFAVAAAVAADADAVLSICPILCTTHPTSQAPPCCMPPTMQTIGRTRHLPGR